jgi:TolB-like protein/class 3 adenylate cyclase/Tfp pilus assembly protein PilF
MSDSTPLVPLDRPRLAAVVFTDVVGYSARMQRDEAATIALVQADFERMRALCAQHGGELLNTMGDGMMLCFPGAGQAVSFALQIQDEFGARKAALPAENALEHRVGVHLGDVFRLADGNVAGDGVNIAARLEAKAPPGGICISQTVYDTVKGKVPMQATFIGPENFKNIAQPIPIWHVMSANMAGASVSQTSKLSPPAPRRKRWLISALSAGLVLTVAIGGWLWSRRDTSSTPPVGKADIALTDAKSIAVLPFTNMSDNKDNAYFADGMQEELLTQLALLGGLKVVSRTSVMDYRDSKKNMHQIGAELGASSLVEGSVRRAGNSVRVTAQLIDAGSDKHLWANSYDRELKDIFAIQSELATEIARALKVSLSPHDQARLTRRPTENLAAYDLFLRHQELVNRSKGTFRTVSTVKERIALLSQAVELDPNFALAWAKLGAEHARAYSIGIDGTASRLTLARQAIERALALAPNDIEVQIEEGTFYLYGSKEYGRSAQAFESVLRIAPNNVDARLQLALVRHREHKWAENAAQLEKVLAIDARNVGALTAYANLMWNFRYFDRALAVQQQLINIRPDDVDLQGKYQRIDYSKTGVWDSFDKWRSTLSPGVERTLGRVWQLDRDRAWARRDFDGVMRLLDAVPEDTQSVESDKLGIGTERAIVFLARGDRPRAMAAARTVLAQATATLRDRPDDLDLWAYSYVSRAILGERDAALAEHRRAHALAVASKDHYRTADDVSDDILGLNALLGDREQALQELSRQLKKPGSFAHFIRFDGALFSLWDDPAFKGIVNDPANNAPLPLNLQERVSTGK